LTDLPYRLTTGQMRFPRQQVVDRGGQSADVGEMLLVVHEVGGVSQPACRPHEFGVQPLTEPVSVTGPLTVLRVLIARCST
jgi:hypothetical protein